MAQLAHPNQNEALSVDARQDEMPKNETKLQISSNLEDVS